MNNDHRCVVFTQRDALILYAVFRCGTFNSQVTIAEIISFYDYINRDVLTFKALSESLLRLQATGWVKMERDFVMVTRLHRAWRERKFRDKKMISVHLELKETVIYLNLNFSLLPHSLYDNQTLPLDEMEFEKVQQRYLSVCNG